MFFDLKNDKKTSDIIISSLTINVNDEFKNKLINLLNYVVNNTEVFEPLKKEISDLVDDLSDLILPSISKLFYLIYIEPPTLFKNKYALSRLELYQMFFDIDDFSEYFVEMIIDCQSLLNKFTYLDNSVELLSLIVNNYIAKLVSMVLETTDIDLELRNQKKVKRNNKLNKIIGI